MKRILLLAALAIGIAGPAHAGPVMAAVAWVGSTMAAGGVAGALLRIAVGIGAQLLAGVLSKSMAQKPKVDVQFEVEIGDDTPLAFIAGDYATAGKRKYLGSWGKNSRYITEVIEVSSLPQPGLAALWVNDEAGVMLTGTTDTDGTGYNLGTPVTNLDDDGHRIWVRWIGGAQTAADAMLVAVFGSDPDYPWTADMIGTGKSYVIVTTRYDSDTLTSYPTYLWQPEPLPMYDPRKDGSAGGTGSHRWGNRSTYEPTRNAAVIAYNVARGIYYGSEWVFGGKNLPAWRLPRAEWVAAMTACDRAISLAAGGTEPAFRAGLEIRADMTAADVLEELGRAANMRFAEVGGMLKPIVGIPGAAVFAFTDDDILITQGQSFKPFESLSATYNALSATYPEPAEKWTTKDAPEFIHAAATADDGGRYLPTSIAYAAAPYRRQVQRLMRAQMRDYRRFRTHQFYLPPDAYGLEPLVDVVSWTSARNGYVNKLFVVESLDKTPGMNVLVTLREVDPSDYDWSSDFELPTSVVAPKPVRPWVQAVAGFGAEAVLVTDNATKARSVAIRATCGSDEVGVTNIRIQVRKSGATDPSIDVLRPYDTPYAWLIHAVNQRTTYQVRARLMSELTPKGSWSGWITVTTGSVYVDDSDFAGGVTSLFENAGLKATRIIANLSVPGTKVGELAWCLADSRLYRWTGSAWVHFIQENLTGVLDETAFAQNIRIPKLVTTLPASGNKVGDMVVRQSEPTKIYTWDGTAWKAEVPADIIVGKLTAIQIGAAAIGTEQLAARVITASKMAISDLTNLVPDSELQDVAGWQGVQNDGLGVLALRPTTGLTWPKTEGDIVYYAARNTANTDVQAVSGFIPVTAGDVLYLAGQMNRIGGTKMRGFLGINFYAKDKGFVSASTIYSVNGTAQSTAIQSSEATVPAGVFFVRYRFYIYAADTDGNVAFASPTIRFKNKGELIVDGTIKGTHIEFETLTGGLMAPAGIITKVAQIESGLIGSVHIANFIQSDNFNLANGTGWRLDKAGTNAGRLIVPDAQIGTLKLAGGAVTFTTVVEPADVPASGLSGSYTTYASLTLTLAYPAGVVIGGGCQMLNASTSSGALNVRARMLGADIKGSSDSCMPSIISPPYSSFVYAANLPAGTHTISMQAQAAGSTAGKTVANIFLYALRAYR